jgi:hypothetical protein
VRQLPIGSDGFFMEAKDFANWRMAPDLVTEQSSVKRYYGMGVVYITISDIKSEIYGGGGIRAAASTKTGFVKYKRLSEGFGKNHWS